jgi:hypothetical protein
MKIWISTERGDDKIIGYHGNSIYKVNPKAEEIESVAY